jgi:hypothetical protein
MVCTCEVRLASLAHPVSLIQPNRPDRPDGLVVPNPGYDEADDDCQEGNCDDWNDKN